MQIQELAIHAPDAELDGDVVVPGDALGCVVFAHGSGSSRRSPRNQRVARALNEAHLATVLFDLLTPDEARRDAVDASLRFDIDLLGGRLVATVDQVTASEGLRSLPVGLFGASTGAAAALVCAARRPSSVWSVVSRGGRPDLAADALPQVQAPTLLLVGELDRRVLVLNEDAGRRLGGEWQLSVVPGASHLFEEPGTLDEVSRRAADWFRRTLAAPTAPLT